MSHDALHIPLSKTEVLQSLERALDSQFIDNLRNRHPNVQLDNKLRGYVGELAFKKWLHENEISCETSNLIDHESGMDVDFVFNQNGSKINLELKTSLIPDYDEVLEEVIKKRDIKLIRRGNQSIEQLKADVHVQFFFKQLRIRKDEWLKKQSITLNEDVEIIYNKLAAFRYETDTFFVRWIDKKSLIELLQKKSERQKIWFFGKREFWTCNLEKDAKMPDELINYLKK